MARFIIEEPQQYIIEEPQQYIIEEPSVFNPPVTAGNRANAATSGINRGIASLLGLPVDTAENALNLALAGVGTVAGMAGRPDLMPAPMRGTIGGSESISRGMNALGINTEEQSTAYDPASRMLYRGGIVAGGSVPFMFNPAGVRQALTAGTGAAIGGEVSDNPLAPAIGAITPQALSSSLSAATRAAMGTSGPSTIRAFEQAGIDPTLGQATGKTWIQGLENLSSKYPGGVTAFRDFIDRQQSGLGLKVSTGTEAVKAGKAIEQGIKRDGGFLDRSQATWRQLDDKLSQSMPPDHQATPVKTLEALDRLTKPLEGAEGAGSVLRTGKLASLRDALVKDMAATPGRTVTVPGVANVKTPGQPAATTIPYESLRQLRSRVGLMLDDALTRDIPQGELAAVYKAMSEDIKTAAQAAGPSASAAWYRQNKYWAARQARVDDVLKNVLGKTFEETFLNAAPRNVDEVSKIRATMRSLTPDEREIVSSAVVNRLGRATPGRQGAEGDRFSSDTFLTNWNRMSAGAKAQLFQDQAYRQSLDAVAKVAERIKTSSEVLRNSSGTAGAGAPYALAGASAYGLASGDATPLMGAVATVAGNGILARYVFTNPATVKWLAGASRSKPADVPKQLARLTAIVNASQDPEEKSALEEFAATLGN